MVWVRQVLYYDSGVGERFIQGQLVDDAQVQVWADEAEAGYDVVTLAKRWGRPLRADSASQEIATRFSDQELDQLMRKAKQVGVDRSTAIRHAVREWVSA